MWHIYLTLRMKWNHEKYQLQSPWGLNNLWSRFGGDWKSVDWRNGGTHKHTNRSPIIWVIRYRVRAINNEWKCMEISQYTLISKVQGGIMRKVKLWPLQPCCFDMSLQRLKGILSLHGASKQGIVFISLSLWATLLKTSGIDDWHVAGSWQLAMHFWGV